MRCARRAEGPWELQTQCNGAHAAAIRSLVEVDGSGEFASCSNDGLIHLWNKRGERVARLGCESASFKYVVLPIGDTALVSHVCPSTLEHIDI